MEFIRECVLIACKGMLGYIFIGVFFYSIAKIIDYVSNIPSN
jgi:hypothetical protein